LPFNFTQGNPELAEGLDGNLSKPSREYREDIFINSLGGCSEWDYQRFTHLPYPSGYRLMIVSVILQFCLFRIGFQDLSTLKHQLLPVGAYTPSPVFCCLDFPLRSYKLNVVAVLPPEHSYYIILKLNY